MKPKFRGIYIPLLTTFTEEGEVDFKIVGELTEFMIDAGVHGLFVLPALDIVRRVMSRAGKTDLGEPDRATKSPLTATGKRLLLGTGS